MPSFTGVLRESSILKIGVEEHLLDIRNWLKFMSQVLLSFDSKHRQAKTKTPQPIFTATENLFSGRKQTRKKITKLIS